MSEPLSRRKFSQILTLSGASAALASASPSLSPSAAENTVSINNDFFTIHFHPRTGRFDVHRQDGTPLLSNATVRVNLDSGRRSLADAVFAHTADSQSVRDELGTGTLLIITSRDKDSKIQIQSCITLYDHSSAIFIEVGCRNDSSRTALLKSIEPLCLREPEGGILNWAGTSKVLTNGAMYYDAGQLHDLDTPFKAAEPYGPTKGGRLAPDFQFPHPERVHSWWNIGLFRGYDKEGLVCGFIENDSGLGQIILSRSASRDLSLYTEAVFAPMTRLQPGQSMRSGRFMITLAADPYSALEQYADAMGKLHPRPNRSIVNGWCEWFYTYEFINEEEVIRNAEYAAKYLKPYGFEYIQIDEGYQRYHGDWEGNERFPHGMKWLADRIKSVGLRPGLWLAPYVISEPTEVFQKHPEWLLRHSDGRLMRVGPWPSEDTEWARNEKPKRYGLDITHPGAAAWLHTLFDTAANQWGYEMFKIDFVAWSLLSAHHYYDKTATPAQAYRKGMDIIRRAIGPDRHLNDCGPGPVSVGLMDSMRIDCDQNYGYAKAAWQQYFPDSSSSASAAAKRYYFHQRTWINDADHVCLHNLSIPQSQAAASIIALSGGNIISGDRLPDLDPVRLEILKKIYPSAGQAGRPVDLFDSDRPTVFSLPIKKSFGEWSIVGFFNPSLSDTKRYQFPLQRLWLNPHKTYLAYDFWLERFLGEIGGQIDLNVLPGHATVLALHEKRDIPQVIATDRHVLMGAVELEDVAWDATTRTLSGLSLGPLHTAHNVAVHLVEKVDWVQGKRSIHHDFDGYTLKLMDEHILRVHVRFEQSERVPWRVDMNALAH